MAEKIFVRPGNVSAGILRKAINRAENAENKAEAATEEALWGHSWSWGGNTHLLFDDSAINMILSAELELRSINNKLHKLAAILDSGPEAMREIDRRYKSNLKEWRKKGDHNTILWVAGGGASTAKEETIISEKPSIPETSAYINWTSGTKGKIRHVNQLGDLSNNGWGKYANQPTKTGTYPSNECGTAGQSMALSYIGVDASPESIIDNGQGITYWSCSDESKYGYDVNVHPKSTINVPGYIYHSGGEYKERMDDMLSTYIADDNYNTSPVVIHYKSGANEHTLVVIAQNEQGYIVVDPASGQEPHVVQITENGEVYSQDPNYKLSHGGGILDGVIQYSLP